MKSYFKSIELFNVIKSTKADWLKNLTRTKRKGKISGRKIALLRARGRKIERESVEVR
jgi:hypothetical protein